MAAELEVGGAMTPERANQVALDVVRRIVGAAHPFELNVAGTAVSIVVTGQEPSPWPKPVVGLDDSRHAPWPPRVRVRAEWSGGGVGLEVLALVGDRRREMVAIVVRMWPRRTKVCWSSVGAMLENSDEPEVAVPNWFTLKKRGAGPAQDARNKKLRALVAESGLPLLGESAAELFTVQADEGTVRPSPDVAFERVVHVALLKLDFFSRGAEAQARGRPLVDLIALGLDDGIDEIAEYDEEEERNYWVGGARDADELREFVEGGFWESRVPRDAEAASARQTWQLFDQIGPGDVFALKGVGRDPQLVIHDVGEVIRVDRGRGRLDLRSFGSGRRYNGPVPPAPGVGSWSDPLVSVTRESVVELLFGEKDDSPRALAWSGPRNVILYGPPGTGKTYQLRDDYRPRFTREARAREVELDALLELGWFEVVAAALADSKGKATVMELSEHPFVRTKYRAKDHKAPIGSRLWATLQAHTVETSKTVNYARRFGDLVFDKREDGTWFFPSGVPEETAALVEQLRPRPAEVAEDYLFVTFHQSYAYEDFIEGIRPQTREADDDSGATLGYALEDGVFLRAANAAVRLAGFDGTVNDLCQESREKRRAVFENAPPFGVFVDEINRGNVSRIFGELITLIEEDKRLGAEGEIIVTLPYSRRKFGVPKNLCLVGTMNTADRSVEALDSALRRRFSFIECAPDYAVLGSTTVEGGVEIAPMLRTINARLEVLLDRDHLIGHAYFVPVRDEPTIAKLKEVFAMNILPLLSEYFYADLGRVGLVLGPRFVQRVGAHTALASFDHEAADQLAERASYRLTPIDSVSTTDFRSIYEGTGG